MMAGELLAVSAVSKQYPGGLLANDGVDLGIRAGEVFGLLGPNGAGKTTLVGQVLGLLAPTSGSIHIDGVDVVADPGAARRLCSYQPQGDVPVRGLTPIEAVTLAGRLRGGDQAVMRARGAELLERLDLGAWSSSRRPLSGGVARLVGFCMAAVSPGRVVVLDEPTNDVDPLRRKLLWALVRELADGGAAILLVTHNVLEAERCVDRLAIMNGGRIVASGTPAALRAQVGGGLRMELVVDPGRVPPPTPACLRRPFLMGSRVVAEVDPNDVPGAVAWAIEARGHDRIAEFLLVPVSLEDVYARSVAGTQVTGTPLEAAEERRAALV